MSNSTFKPTHVRCVRYGHYDGVFTVGKVYKIFKTTSYGVEVETNTSKGYDDSVLVFHYEFKKGHTGRYRFIYVGPPAILGEPKTIIEGSPK